VDTVTVDDGNAIETDAVHRYLVCHNLRAVPGNIDGQGLYGLPATMNGTGYERKRGGRPWPPTFDPDGCPEGHAWTETQTP
jgi:hypothetical protein